MGAVHKSTVRPGPVRRRRKGEEEKNGNRTVFFILKNASWETSGTSSPFPGPDLCPTETWKKKEPSPSSEKEKKGG